MMHAIFSLRKKISNSYYNQHLNLKIPFFRHMIFAIFFESHQSYNSPPIWQISWKNTTEEERLKKLRLSKVVNFLHCSALFHVDSCIIHMVLEWSETRSLTLTTFNAEFDMVSHIGIWPSYSPTSKGRLILFPWELPPLLLLLLLLSLKRLMLDHSQPASIGC